MQALERFRGEGEVVVMLASLLASGTGITVTCAQQVVLMEPYWNPFVSPAGPPCYPCWAPLLALREPYWNPFASPTGTPLLAPLGPLC